MPKVRKTRTRKHAHQLADVVSDVLYLFGGFSFTSEEFAAEMAHYCKIIGIDPPHHTQVGKCLSSLGYVATRDRVNGKRVRLYAYKLKLAKKRS